MSAPLELRYHLRRYTLADAEAGVQPIRQMYPEGVKLFAPPMLEFRLLSKGQWSDWLDVKYVREGDEPKEA